MKLIDIHNHVLPSIDDGSKTIDETIQMLKMAEKGNIDQIILTPHFKEDSILNTKDVINYHVNLLEEIILENDIKIKIHPGCEIFLTKNTGSLLSQKKLQTLNNTKYILVEIHRLKDFWLMNLKEELYNLSVDGYKVVLAHPERYEITHENPNYIYDLVSEGHYMQINVNSLKPNHPNHKIVRKLLDANLVHFIASDAHDLKHRPFKLDEGYEFIEKNYNKQYADDLFYNNPLNVLLNKNVPNKDFHKIKNKKFIIF